MSLHRLAPTGLVLKDSGALVAESYSGGFLAGLAVTSVLDARLRRATNGLTLNSSFLHPG